MLRLAKRSRAKGILRQCQQVMPLLAQLNPKITGWSNYFGYGAGYRILSWCDYKLYRLLMWWASKKHPTRTYRWIVNKYFVGFGMVNSPRNWVFGYVDAGSTITLNQHTDAGIKRPIKV